MLSDIFYSYIPRYAYRNDQLSNDGEDVQDEMEDAEMEDQIEEYDGPSARGNR